MLKIIVETETGNKLDITERVLENQNTRLSKRQEKKNISDEDMKQYLAIVDAFNEKATSIKTETELRKELEEINKLEKEVRAEDRTKAYTYFTISKSYLQAILDTNKEVLGL